MNKFINAIKELDLASMDEMLKPGSKWIGWSEPDGKNALHYLGGVEISKMPDQTAVSLEILKLLLESGLSINSIHKIAGNNCGFFPATPLWYAYTRGRNETLFTYLLENGANPDHCMFAIAWYDDVKSAELFKKHGAKLTDESGKDTPFLGAFAWKKFSMAEWFLENGADVNVADEKGNTALFYAVSMKRKYEAEDIKLLLKYGADFNKENNEGKSPKKVAELQNRKAILELFNQS